MVKIYDGATLVGTTTASATGVWSVTTSALPDGVNTLSATASNAQNVTSLVSGSTSITVAGKALLAPTTPTGSIISTTIVPLQGSGGIPGATIDLMDNGSVIGHTTVTASGTWSLTITLVPDLHQLTVNQIDTNGNTGPVSAVMSLSVQLPPPPMQPSTTVAVATPLAPAAPVIASTLPPVTVINAAVNENVSFNEVNPLSSLSTASTVSTVSPVSTVNTASPVSTVSTVSPVSPVSTVSTVSTISTASPVSQASQASQSAMTTSGAGFQVSLSNAPPPKAVSDGSLFVSKGIPSLISQTSLITFTVPGDAFGHSEADASIQLAAKLSDGRPLPKWLSFDSTRGTFVGQVPESWHGALSVVVSARDNSGHEVSTTFRIEAGSGDGAIQESAPAKPLPADGARDAKPVNLGDTSKHSQGHTKHLVGKLAFTQQLKLAARNAAIRFL
jgi:Bacterial Ig domain